MRRVQAQQFSGSGGFAASQGRTGWYRPFGRLPVRFESAALARTMLSFSFAGAVADVDFTTANDPRHPAPVLLLELGHKIVRVVLPRAVARSISVSSSIASARAVLQVGRVVRVDGRLESAAQCVPVAEHVGFLDLH